MNSKFKTLLKVYPQLEEQSKILARQIKFQNDIKCILDFLCELYINRYKGFRKLIRTVLILVKLFYEASKCKDILHTKNIDDFSHVMYLILNFRPAVNFFL